MWKFPFVLIAAELLIASCFSPIAVADDDLHLTLPDQLYAVEGEEIGIYFDNIILSEHPEVYSFKVDCSIGEQSPSRWWVKPGRADVGKRMLHVSVSSKSGDLLAEDSSVLEILPANAGAEVPNKVQLLIIGDSLTHATIYPNRLAELLSQGGNPAFEMLGTHHPKSAKENVFHEGYGGWTWQRFAAHYEPNPDGTYRKRSSPFVFLDDSEKPELDFNRYFEEKCAGVRPDYIVIMLGINDCFGAPPDDSSGIDARIDKMFKHSEELLKNLRSAAPNAQIGICATTPPNSRQAAFQANYKDRYTRWGWKRIQHRLVQRQMQYVNEMHDPNFSLIPTQLNLDPYAGYPENNGVHPNQVGYHQIATSIYAWLKVRLRASLAE